MSQVLTPVTESEQGQRDVSIQLFNTFLNLTLSYK